MQGWIFSSDAGADISSSDAGVDIFISGSKSPYLMYDRTFYLMQEWIFFMWCRWGVILVHFLFSISWFKLLHLNFLIQFEVVTVNLQYFRLWSGKLVCTDKKRSIQAAGDSWQVLIITWSESEVGAGLANFMVRVSTTSRKLVLEWQIIIHFLFWLLVWISNYCFLLFFISFISLKLRLVNCTWNMESFQWMGYLLVFFLQRILMHSAASGVTLPLLALWSAGLGVAPCSLTFF